MLPNSEHQPFLGYTDENQSDDKPRPYPDEPRRPSFYRRRCGLFSLSASHIVVCVVTSLAWILAGLLLMPRQSACNAGSGAQNASPSTHQSHHPSSHHGSASEHHKTGPSKTGANHPALGFELNHNLTSHAKLVTCGSSTKEAKKLGCKYDIMLNDWVPSECWDPEAISEYQDDDSWQAYRDANLTELIPTIDEMSEMEFYFTTQKDHINHCAMLWRKQFNKFYYESPTFDTVIGDAMHTEHCTQYFIDMAARIKEWETETVRTEVGWSGCWIRDGPRDW